jgi:hypothetical protein
VLQAALGGSLTLPTEVCDECNAAFSPLDQDLVNFADIFIRGRVTKLLGLGLQEDPSGVLISARHGLKGPEQGLAVTLPQAFRLPDGTWAFRAGSRAALDAMFQELATPARDVSTDVVPPVAGAVPAALAVVRTGPSKFLVRGSNATDVDGLRRRLQEEGLKTTYVGDAQEWIPPDRVSPINIRFEIPVTRLARVLAKVALNYVCSLFGPQTVLRAEFDPIRRFARYGEGAFVDFVSLAILDHEQREEPNPFAHPARHALVLLEAPTESIYRAGVKVVLYGRAVAFVHLGSSLAPLLPPGTWRVTYFHHQQKTFEHLRVPVDGLRCFVNLIAIVPEAADLLQESG